MDNKILLSLIMVHVENKLRNMPVAQRGPRGIDGCPGEDGVNGRDGRDGKDGRDGRDGRNGKDFSLDEHRDQLLEWITEASLTFDKLSDAQIESLRGPRGLDGKDGNDFNIEDHRETLEKWIKDHSLKFSDLTEDDIESLRGPRGRDGRNGRDFDLEDSLPKILDALSPIVESHFKLSDEDMEKLRGPSGKDGRPGRDFVFEDHEHDIWELVAKAVSNSTDELKLKYSDLTDDDKQSLKLKFKDLTEEDLILLKGDRGPMGPRGARGQKGSKGEKGDSGTNGLNGTPGINGRDGKDGKNGEDAPSIIEVRIMEEREKYYFRFFFSDSTYLDTNKIKKTKEVITYFAGGGAGGGGGGGGGTGDNSVIISDPTTNYGPRKEIEFAGDLITTPEGSDKVIVTVDASISIAKDGATLGDMRELDIGEGIEVAYDVDTKKATLSVTDPNVLYNYTCETEVYEGAVVFLYKGISEALLVEWVPMEVAVPLNFEIEYPQAGLALASDNIRSRPIGICIKRYVSDGREKCDIRILGRVPGFSGLDMSRDYFLSNTVPGAIVREDDLALTTGQYKVRIGQPVTETEFFFNRGDRNLVP